jgi:hypothetical protein
MPSANGRANINNERHERGEQARLTVLRDLERNVVFSGEHAPALLSTKRGAPPRTGPKRKAALTPHNIAGDSTKRPRLDIRHAAVPRQTRTSPSAIPAALKPIVPVEAPVTKSQVATAIPASVEPTAPVQTPAPIAQVTPSTKRIMLTPLGTPMRFHLSSDVSATARILLVRRCRPTLAHEQRADACRSSWAAL